MKYPYLIWAIFIVLLSFLYVSFQIDWPIVIVIAGSVGGLTSALLFFLIDKYILRKNIKGKGILILVRLLLIGVLVVGTFHLHKYLEHSF